MVKIEAKSHEQRIFEQEQRLSRLEKRREKQQGKALQKLDQEIRKTRQGLQKLASTQAPEKTPKELIQKTADFSFKKHLRNLAEIYQMGSVEPTAIAELLDKRIEEQSKAFTSPKLGLSLESFLSQFTILEESASVYFTSQILDLASKKDFDDNDYQKIQKYQEAYEKIASLGKTFVEKLKINTESIVDLQDQQLEGKAKTTNACAIESISEIKKFLRTLPVQKVAFFDSFLELPEDQVLDNILDSATKYFSQLAKAEQYYSPMQDYLELRSSARLGKLAPVQRLLAKGSRPKTVSADYQRVLIDQLQLLNRSKESLPKAITNLFKMLHPAIEDGPLEQNLKKIINRFANRLAPIIDAIDPAAEILAQAEVDMVEKLFSVNPKTYEQAEFELGLQDLKQSLQKQRLDLNGDNDPAALAINNFVTMLKLRSDYFPLL